MRVRWLRTALRKLDSEATYIADHDRHAAKRAARLGVRRILDAVAPLAEQAGLGRARAPAGARERLIARIRRVGPYRVRGEAVEVLRMCHSSRKPLQRA